MFLGHIFSNKLQLQLFKSNSNKNTLTLFVNLSVSVEKLHSPSTGKDCISSREICIYIMLILTVAHAVSALLNLY